MALLEVLQYPNSDSNTATLLCYIFRMILGSILTLISYPIHTVAVISFQNLLVAIFFANPHQYLKPLMMRVGLRKQNWRNHVTRTF